MTAHVESLVTEVVALSGGESPRVLSADAPVLVRSTKDPSDDDFYLIGLIGGKDIGKSSLVNALAGREITPRTSHGPGTETIIAYCHQRKVDDLRRLLEREVPGQYQIIPHEIDALTRQVLVDLPDIDSIHTHHVELTRRMLRHMLFPIWLQSVEKYADAQPRELLARVTEGNAPKNFLFCLNKIDQLIAANGPGAADELRDDYARRLTQTLGLTEPPRIWMISALQPDAYDLPELRAHLSRHKSVAEVNVAWDLADNQRTRSILRWAHAQRLPEQSARLAGLAARCQDALHEQVGLPVLGRAVEGVLRDPGYQKGILDACVGARINRWPFLGIINTLLGWIRWMLPQRHRATSPRAAMDNALTELGLVQRLQFACSQLQLAHGSQLSPLYQQRKPWERAVAEQLAAELCTRLTDLLELQRDRIIATLQQSGGGLSFAWRWLWTIGALLWFPLVQPLLEAFLHGTIDGNLPKIGLLIVQTLSVSFLISKIWFLLIWFSILWLVVHWHTQRLIDRRLKHVFQRTSPDASADPSSIIQDWIDEILGPIRQRQARIDHAIAEIQSLQATLGTDA